MSTAFHSRPTTSPAVASGAQRRDSVKLVLCAARIMADPERPQPLDLSRGTQPTLSLRCTTELPVQTAMSTAFAGSQNLPSADALGKPIVEAARKLASRNPGVGRSRCKARFGKPIVVAAGKLASRNPGMAEAVAKSVYGMSKRRGMQITPRLSRRSRDVRSCDELIRTIVGNRRIGCGSAILDDLSCPVECDRCGSTAGLCCGRAPAALQTILRVDGVRARRRRG